MKKNKQKPVIKTPSLLARWGFQRFRNYRGSKIYHIAGVCEFPHDTIRLMKITQNF